MYGLFLKFIEEVYYKFQKKSSINFKNNGNKSLFLKFINGYFPSQVSL